MKFIFNVILFVLLYSIISSIFKMIFRKKATENQKDGSTIIRDTQPHEKIITRNEGEYVDFEEVKEDNPTKNASQN